jgi:ribosomal protein S18 acetylase RimI-like enzyme
MRQDEAGVTAIRRGQPEEADAVLELWRQAGATPSATDTVDDVRRVMTAGTACLLVAEVDGQVVGSIIGAFDGWRGNLYRLAVHPDHRRRGIARALVVEVERWLREQGAKRITALVESDHSDALGFWEAAGYALDPRMCRYVRAL